MIKEITTYEILTCKSPSDMCSLQPEICGTNFSMHSDLCVPSCSAVEDCTITVSSSNNSSNCNSSSCIKRTRSDSDCTKFISIDSESEWEDENDANYDSNGKIARLQNVEEQMKLGKCSEVPNENGTRVTYEESSTELFPFPSSNGSDGMNTCLTKILPSKGRNLIKFRTNSESNCCKTWLYRKEVVRNGNNKGNNRTKRAANRHRLSVYNFEIICSSKYSIVSDAPIVLIRQLSLAR
uniref:BPTI/Kunitz inhibitor domain-containing protein n=1 Tax=Heterorhabditis bacteriophora TaxID=37862 RepID=A0A1I7WAY5_HETBA